MRKFLFVPLLAAFLVAGCEDDNPNQPTEIVPTFQMALLSSNEVPPITDVEATCTGNVTIRLNLTRDAAQTITAATADFTANISGCPSTTNITIAHIHEQVAGQNGIIVVNTGLNGGVGSNGSFTRNGINITDLSIVQRILDNPSGFYFNIHSTLHGPGVIRAQLVRTQ
jgi:hypothetical protein